MRGAQCVKNGCVAEIASRRVRGDLWTVGNPLRDAELTWIMRVTSYDPPGNSAHCHAVFETWYQWWEEGILHELHERNGNRLAVETVLLPPPTKFDFDGFELSHHHNERV